MKRWAGVVAILLLVPVGAMILAPSFQPTELERRLTTVRPGMTREEVAGVMNPDKSDVPHEFTANGYRFWSWMCPGSFGRPTKQLFVRFDDDGRVIATSTLNRTESGTRP